MRIKMILGIFLLSIFSLSAQERRMGLKYVNPHKIPWMEEAKLKIARQPLPDSIDYSHGMPPVGSQHLGSCTAWATGYYYKGYQEYVDHGGWDMTDPDHQFQPKFIYNQINGGVDGGSYFCDAFKCLSDLGVAPMSSGSYASQDSVSWPKERGYNDAIAFRCEQALYIDSLWLDGKIDELKAHMVNDNDCAVIGISVWDPFYLNTLGPNYIYDTGDTTGKIWGGHAICLVGYNDSLDTPDGKGAFRLVNSWDTWWADSGYAWITYEAVKSSSICYGDAYYATDKKNYQPTSKIAYKVSHINRLDIEVRVVIGPIGSPHWQSPLFFDWYESKKQQYPYPDNAVILDITDGVEYLSYNKVDTIYIKVRDTGSDGIAGVVNDFSASSNEWSFHCPSPDTPMVMAVYGYTNLKLFFPNNAQPWQSFHRLSDNSGFVDLVGDMDSSRVLWTFSTNDSIESSPIIADIDGDGTLEIVIGSNDSTLYAVNADSSELWHYNTGGKVLGAPATSDLDGDGKLEVVASSSNKKIVSLNGEDGLFNWEYSFIISGVPGSPAVNYLDSDRKLEVVGVGHFICTINGENGSSGKMHINGTPTKSSPAVGDVYDANGRMEIVFGQGNSVKFFDGVEGILLTSFTTSGEVNSSAAIGDIDGDSLMELVIGSDDDTLYALEMDSLLWKFGTNGDVRSSPALGDIDGDSKLEVVFGSNDSNVYALNAEDGSPYWLYPTGGEVISSPALADINNDGTVDIVVGSVDGYLYAISGDGSLLWDLYLGTSITSSPALGDIDKDGYLEVAVGGLNGNLYLIDDFYSGIGEEIPLVSLYLSKIENPLSCGTTIHYSIPERGAVNLSMFDITGRKIKKLVNKVQNAGQYQSSINIDGLPNGIYFCRLTHSGKTISRKLVVVR